RPPPPTSTLFPYTTLFRSERRELGLARHDRRSLVDRSGRVLQAVARQDAHDAPRGPVAQQPGDRGSRGRLAEDALFAAQKAIRPDRKSTRLNSSHSQISYA